MKCKYILTHQPQKSGLLKSSWDDTVAKLERWARKNKSEVVHIKSQELCDSCRWSFERCRCLCAECKRLILPREAGQRSCQCLNIKNGDHCPYYEEAHHD